MSQLTLEEYESDKRTAGRKEVPLSKETRNRLMRSHVEDAMGKAGMKVVGEKRGFLRGLFRL